MSDQVLARPRVVEGVDRVIGGVSGALAVLACLWIAVLMLWIVADVLGRALDIRGIVGTVTVSADSVVAISFLCVPFTMRKGGHIRSTIVVDRFPRTISAAMLAFAYLLGTLSFLIVAWTSWEPMVSSFVSGEYSGEGALHVPTAPFRAVVVGASALMFLECVLATDRTVRSAVRSFKERRHHE